MLFRSAPYAARTVRDGLSARAGLAAARAAGARTGDAKWFRLVAEARRTLSESLLETGRPLARRPTGNEITTVTSRKHSGYWQQVEVFWRDRVSGEVGSSPFVHRSDGLVTRQAAVNFALGEWAAGGAGSVNQDDYEVLGASYVSTLELRIEE